LTDKPPQALRERAIEFTPARPVELAKAIALLVLVGLLIWNWGLFESWIRSATRLEFAGVRIERSLAREKLDHLKEASPAFDPQRASEELALGEQLWPALNGAHVLWLDDDAKRHRGEQEFLEIYGIHFSRARDVPGALWLLGADMPYDLVIVHAPQASADARKLASCPVVFSAWPSDAARKQFEGDLAKFNTQQNASMEIGEFLFVEQVHHIAPDLPVIVYSEENGLAAATKCAQVTNDVNAFLSDAMLSLAHRRWQQIDDWLSRTPKGTNSGR
jgi:hypothetical protein